MIDVLLLARAHLYTALRERITLFWVLMFPVFLLAILSLIFGRIGQEGEISFDVSLVRLDLGAASEFAVRVETLFVEIGTAHGEGKEPLFKLFRPEGEQDVQEFLTREQEALRRGQRAAVIVIPSGFSQHLQRQLASTEDDPLTPDLTSSTLTVYYNEGSPASAMATSIVEQILAGVDRELLERSGRFDPSFSVPTETVWVGGALTDVRYIDFLLPGIILMGFFTNGLFGIPGAILFSREQQVLRRYWVTPLSVPRYLAGLTIGHLSLCLIQFLVLFLVGRFAFNAAVSFWGIVPALYLLLAATTFMALGFLIASMARTGNAAMAIANVLNMPMMFLSGLFFPVTGLPVILLAIVYANPVSYLAEGIRASVGAGSGSFAAPLTIAVPLVWIAVSTLVAAWRLKWDVQR